MSDLQVNSPPHSAEEPGLLDVILRGDLMVLAVGALLLLGGWVVRAQHVDRTVAYDGHGVALEYPRGWSVAEGKAGGDPGAGAALIADLLAGGREAFQPRITVVDEYLPPEIESGAALSDYVRLDLQSSLVLFHGSSRRQLAVPGAGKAGGVRVDFAHAINPAAASGQPGTTDVPVVVRGATVAFAQGTRLRRVTIELSRAQHRAQPELIDRVLASVTGKGGSR